MLYLVSDLMIDSLDELTLYQLISSEFNPTSCLQDLYSRHEHQNSRMMFPEKSYCIKLYCLNLVCVPGYW